MQINLLSNILKESDGELLFNLLSDSFISKNKDVETFLKEKSVQSTKLYTSATYLLYNLDSKADLLGYFTLATKMLTIKPESLTSSQAKVIKRFVSLDSDTNTYRLPAVLLAQFGRNFSENSVSIKGAELMKVALERIEKAVLLTSGKITFLECEPKEKLIKFYENCGFRLLDNVIYSKTSKELVQMFRVI